MAVGAVVARIVSQYSDKGSKAAQKDIAKLGKNIDKFAAKATKAFAVASAAAAAFAIKIGKDAVKAATEDAKSANVLAQTLRNVTGATTEGIAAVEEYIKKQQMAAGVADDELRQSLAALTTATGDATLAMDLQGVALDVAAGTGKDLQTVTMALVRAQQGNLGALKRLGIPLDDTIVKNKDLAAAIAVLNKTYGGQAELLADTDPFKRLQLAYGEILETLGYALLPVLTEFVEYLQSDVLPAIEEWIALNEEQLQQGLRQTVEIIKDLAERAVDFAKFVRANNELIIGIAGVLAALKAYAMALAALTGLKYIAEAALIMAQRFFGVGVAAAGAAPKVGVFASVLKVLRIAIVGVGKAFLALPGPVRLLIIAGSAAAAIYSKIKGNADKATQATLDFATAQRLSARDQKNAILEGFKPIEEATKAAADKAATDARLAKIRSAQNAKEAKDLAKKIALEKQYAKLKKSGIVTTEEDPVQLNAAIALLARQKEIDKRDADALARLREQVMLQKVRNDLATRYDDILKALADNEVTSKEVQILALKWGVTTEAVEGYLLQLRIVEDGTISDSEIIKLAMAWGSTQDQAAQYLDFFVALNDGVLSDAEIEKLKSKWKMTEDQVRMYSDFVGIVNDGKLTDAEIIKIQDKWKLTTDQVVDYIKKIGTPVSYSGTLIDPARAAEIGWLNAIQALQRYQDLLKAGVGAGVTGVPSGTVNGNDPAVIEAAIAAANAAAAAAAEAAAIAAEAEKAAAEAEAAAAQAAGMFLNDIRTATTNADLNKAVQVAQIVGESASDIANAMMQGLLGQGVDVASAASSARYTGQAIAAMQAAEAKAKADADALNRALNSGAIKKDSDFTSITTPSFADYDEKFRFMNSGSSTLNTAKGISGGNLMAAPVVNITVQGSVTAEQDLVQAVRNGLLATQYNGNQLLLEAI
jgi:hypothetical protein